MRTVIQQDFTYIYNGIKNSVAGDDANIAMFCDKRSHRMNPANDLPGDAPGVACPRSQTQTSTMGFPLSLPIRARLLLAAVATLFPGGPARAAAPAAHTVTVAADGSGDFPTVQRAIDAAPEGGTRLFVVQLRPGKYHEKLVIPKTKGPLQLRGNDAATTILTFDDHAASVDAEGKNKGTTGSASVSVQAEDFSAENVAFENAFGPGSQAVAISVSSKRGVFRRCRFLGWQDTVLLREGRQYFEDCYVEGSVDFIFGAATAFFERCELRCLAHGAITAASTPENAAHGFVFSRCRVTAAAGDWKAYLGRPWRPFANVIFLDTELPAAIAPAGWMSWQSAPEREKTARYAEHRSTGPGGGTAERVAWSRQLDDAEASGLTAARVLGWDPHGGLAAERVGALPTAAQEPWWKYLELSAEHRRNEQAAMAAELTAASLQQPVIPPAAPDFKLDPRLAADWFASEPARKLADSVISFQTPSGGWSKHISFERGPRPPGTNWSSDKQPWHYVGTFDNHATTEEMILLARVYQATKREPCRGAFLKGLDYLFDAQFPNGGWPQGYPLEGGYQDEITFNDDAMIHVMELLRDIAAGKPEYLFVDAARRTKAQEAMSRGVDCILRSQFVQNGKKTVWCAQHDPLTLAPAAARLKEPASLSGGESVGVVKFLMDLPRPGTEVVQAVESALAWFEQTKITGVRIVNQHGNRSYVADPTSQQPCWARFSDLATNRPIFAGGQDGVVYASFEALAQHNATSYDYLTSRPQELVEKWQPKWRGERGRPAP